MAAFHRERVEHALNELLERVIPQDADEDDEIADQRIEEAFEFAMEELTTAGDPSLVPDVNHIATLIERKGMAVICSHARQTRLTLS